MSSRRTREISLIRECQQGQIGAEYLIEHRRRKEDYDETRTTIHAGVDKKGPRRLFRVGAAFSPGAGDFPKPSKKKNKGYTMHYSSGDGFVMIHNMKDENETSVFFYKGNESTAC